MSIELAQFSDLGRPTVARDPGVGGTCFGYASAQSPRLAVGA